MNNEEEMTDDRSGQGMAEKAERADQAHQQETSGDVQHDHRDKKECRECRKLKDRIHHLEKDLEKLKSENAHLDDSYRRKVADFDNYRKRMQKMTEDASLESYRRMVSSLLPILDNFSRAMAHAQSDRNFDALFGGLKIAYDEIHHVFDKWGVKPFESVGQEFDPNLHEALMMEDRADVPYDKTVVEELEKGYKMDDFVVRHSKVKVARKQGGNAAAKPAPGGTESMAGRDRPNAEGDTKQ